VLLGSQKKLQGDRPAGMAPMDTYLAIGALVSAGLAVAWDLRQGRIPNRLTYGSIALGFALRAILGGWRGALDGLAAGLVGGGVFFLFFLVRGMGAGDVKLMTAIGIWAGLRHLVVILMVTAIAGGILALGYMIARRRGLSTFRNLGTLLRFHVVVGLAPHPEINLENPQAIRIPYALAIAAGTFYAYGTMFLRG
jgi:prepilin peptidase CpaA